MPHHVHVCPCVGASNPKPPQNPSPNSQDKKQGLALPAIYMHHVSGMSSIGDGLYIMYTLLSLSRCCPSIEVCMHGSWISGHHLPSKIPPHLMVRTASAAAANTAAAGARSGVAAAAAGAGAGGTGQLECSQRVVRYESYSLVVRPCLHAQHSFLLLQALLSQSAPLSLYCQYMYIHIMCHCMTMSLQVQKAKLPPGARREEAREEGGKKRGNLVSKPPGLFRDLNSRRQIFLVINKITRPV